MHDVLSPALGFSKAGKLVRHIRYYVSVGVDPFWGRENIEAGKTLEDAAEPNRLEHALLGSPQERRQWVNPSICT